MVARAARGEFLGRAISFDGEVTRAALPPDIRAAIASCSDVAVVAEPAFHGQSRLLDPALAWSFREGTGLPGRVTAGFAHHVVVSDVEPPADLKLPRLPPWAAPTQPTVHRHLTGAAATPANVLAALEYADLVQFQVIDALRKGQHQLSSDAGAKYLFDNMPYHYASLSDDDARAHRPPI
jgi:cellulose synthase operon protein C